MEPLLRALLVALATGLILEGLALFARRRLATLRWTILPHLFAFAASVAVFLSVNPSTPIRGQRLALVIALVLGLWLALDLMDWFLFERSRDQKAAEQPGVPALIRAIAKLLVLLITGAVLIAELTDVDLMPVLVSSTVLSAVLGLALQDVLRNVFAGVAMQFERVPRKGDWLEIDGEMARIEEMSWRTTRLRTNTGVALVEPNALLAERRLENYGSTSMPIGFEFEVGLPYGCAPRDAAAALERAIRAAPDVVSHPEPSVFLTGYGESSILYRLRVFTRRFDRREMFRDGVNRRIWYELRRAGIAIPFPIRTVQLHDQDRQEQESEEREIAQRERLLHSLELFRDLEPELISRLARSVRRASYDNGERLVQEGDPGYSLMIVTAGKVLVTSSGSGLVTTVGLANLGPGDFFGEMALLTGERRSATVTADGPVEVLVVEKSDLAPLLQADPRLTETLSQALARRLDATETAVEEKKRQRDTGAIELEAAQLGNRIRRFFGLKSQG